MTTREKISQILSDLVLAKHGMMQVDVATNSIILVIQEEINRTLRQVKELYGKEEK